MATAFARPYSEGFGKMLHHCLRDWSVTATLCYQLNCRIFFCLRRCWCGIRDDASEGLGMPMGPSKGGETGEPSTKPATTPLPDTLRSMPARCKETNETGAMT